MRPRRECLGNHRESVRNMGGNTILLRSWAEIRAIFLDGGVKAILVTQWPKRLGWGMELTELMFFFCMK